MPGDDPGERPFGHLNWSVPDELLGAEPSDADDVALYHRPHLPLTMPYPLVAVVPNGNIDDAAHSAIGEKPDGWLVSDVVTSWFGARSGTTAASGAPSAPVASAGRPAAVG